MRAILTSRHPQSFFYPLWERYYSQFFDHLEVCPIEEWNLPHNGDIFLVISANQNKVLAKLLMRYNLVTIVDMDEFLVPDSQIYMDLGNYLDNFNSDVIRGIGYNIMEMADDKPLDLSKKITDQRFYWQRDENYDKPVITKVPIVYQEGNHTCDRKVKQDKDLYLFHLRDADINSCMIRRGVPRSNFKERQDRAIPIPEKWKIL